MIDEGTELATQAFIEHRRLRPEASLSWDLTYHLYTRYSAGPVVIMTDKPAVLLAALRKQWLKAALKLRTEYSRTLGAERRAGIKRLADEMEALPFVVDIPQLVPNPPLTVYFMRPQEIEELRTKHRTIYTINNMEIVDLLRPHLLPEGLICIYTQDGK